MNELRFVENKWQKRLVRGYCTINTEMSAVQNVLYSLLLDLRRRFFGLCTVIGASSS